jgi:hypothetical protein
MTLLVATALADSLQDQTDIDSIFVAKDMQLVPMLNYVLIHEQLSV